MSETWIDRKERLLFEMNKQMIAQLDAAQSEDLERFMYSVEICEQLIREIDMLDQQNQGSVTNRTECMQNIGQEILRIRMQISDLLPAWREKIRNGMLQEQANTRFKQAYEEDQNIPPIFLDKRN